MGNNHSEQQQDKAGGRSSCEEDIEKGKTKKAALPEKTDQPPVTSCFKTKTNNSFTHNLNHFEPVSPDLFRGIPVFSGSMGQGLCCPPHPSSPPGLPPISSVPTFSAVHSSPKQPQEHRAVNIPPIITRTENSVQPQAPQVKPPPSSKSQQSLSTATVLAHPPPHQNQESVISKKAPIKPQTTDQRSAVKKPINVSCQKSRGINPNAAPFISTKAQGHPLPPPHQNQESVISKKAPIKPQATDQRPAVKKPLKMTCEKSLNPNAASFISTKAQGPTKVQPLTVKASSGTAPPLNVSTTASSGNRGSKSKMDPPEVSEKSSSLNVPPNSPLSKKALEKRIDFCFIKNQEINPSPPTLHKQAVVRRALNGEPYSEAAKGPVTKVNPARKETKAQKKIRITKPSSKQATDSPSLAPGNDSSITQTSQPSSKPSNIPASIAPSVAPVPSTPAVTPEPVPGKPRAAPLLGKPTVATVPSTPIVTQVPIASERNKPTFIPEPIRKPSSSLVPSAQKEKLLGNQAQVNTKAKATETLGLRTTPNSSKQPAIRPAGNPHCCPKSEQGRALAVRIRLQLKTAQPIDGNQGTPENAEATPVTKQVKLPSAEKKLFQQEASAATKEKKHEPDPLIMPLATQAKYHAESEILMDRFRKHTIEKATQDNPCVIATTLSEFHYYSGEVQKYIDKKCSSFSCSATIVPPPHMSDTSIVFNAISELCKSNTTTTTAAETETTQSPTSDVNPTAAPAQGAATLVPPTQERYPLKEPKASFPAYSNKTTGKEKEARQDDKESKTEEIQDEPSSPERPPRPEGRWHPFSVDRSCSRKARCQHNNAALPRNITKWLNVSRNYLCEPPWVTTATLAASLALRERPEGGGS